MSSMVRVHARHGGGTCCHGGGTCQVHDRHMFCICHLILAIGWNHGWALILYIFMWPLHVVWSGFLEAQWLGPKSKQPTQTWWMWRCLCDLASSLLCWLWKPTNRVLPTSKQKRHRFYPFTGGTARSWRKGRMRWGHRYNNLWTTTHQSQLFLFIIHGWGHHNLYLSWHESLVALAPSWV